MAIKIFDSTDVLRFDTLREALSTDGVFIVRGAVDKGDIDVLCEDLRLAFGAISQKVGSDSLARAGESGVVRAPLAHSQNFLHLATRHALMPFIESIVGEASILHLQNGFILAPANKQQVDSTKVFQGTWHRDFPRFTGNVPLTLNAFVALTPFTRETGATEFILGSHLSDDSLEDHLASGRLEIATGNPGDMVIFDSTIWHRAGVNVSKEDRLAVNQQYTFSWMKQQLQMWSLFEEREIRGFDSRVQQLLGYFTRVPAKYEEFYTAPEARLYRSGQG